MAYDAMYNPNSYEFVKSSWDRMLEEQVDGSHYKNYPIQPIEYITANKLNFIEGNIVKLITRHRDKGGVVDIDKLIHYAQLLKYFEYQGGKKLNGSQTVDVCYSKLD